MSISRVKEGFVAHDLRKCKGELGIVAERVLVILYHGAFIVPFVDR